MTMILIENLPCHDINRKFTPKKKFIPKILSSIKFILLFLRVDDNSLASERIYINKYKSIKTKTL